MKNNILAIDPSGTGTTGLFFTNGTKEQFKQFTSQDWKEHLSFLVGLVQTFKPSLVIYEHTNFISLRGKDMTSLLKLLGAIEFLPIVFPSLGLNTMAVPVDQVKRLKKKLLKGEQTIAELEYKKGKGWHHNQKKISVHCLDAYLVYWIWEGKQKSSLADKTMPNLKTKQIIRNND